ncbi:DUF2062 domain-containing protein [Thalassoglobus polymorphus]|uniref:DUF2062 domain-containing protein n=1 Tax=Thalassoglobus polymorphus TaxID=2527994 RepID=A0A517QJT7_9PLAN|nr:DUF2062 domain-containing protein [Thalassoglobus polymorphus]QDT31898.1 hypothetical protein Mal48_11350 [Thalassoglobus polymorphus]
MTQQVMNPDDAVSTTPARLTCPQRVDGPHLFSTQLFAFDDEYGCPSGNFSMSWQSRLIWWCDPRQWLHAILQLKDTPHSIAMGTAIGIFIGLTPTFGIQMLLVLAVAFLTQPFFRFNRFAALVAVYISNPFTMIPIYWMNYRIGAMFTHTQISWKEFVSLFQYSSYTEWWSTFSNVFYTLGTPLIIGSFLVATVLSLPTYPLILRLSERVQARRAARVQSRTEEASRGPKSAEMTEPERSSIS